MKTDKAVTFLESPGHVSIDLVGNYHWDIVTVKPEIAIEGRKQLKIVAGSNNITIAISKTGSSIRVFDKNGKEMKV